MRTPEGSVALMKSWRHWLNAARKWADVDECKSQLAYESAVACWSDWCEALKREGRPVPAGTSPYDLPAQPDS
jgi:hypothetical protein